KLRFLGWEHLFVYPMPYVHDGEVVEYYVNFEVVDEGRVKSHVHGVQFKLLEAMLGEIFHVVVVGYMEYNKIKILRLFTHNEVHIRSVSDGSGRVLRGNGGVI
ncbi:hypothetical protein HAX54_051397, partial [Datura stramonium]|nr:hypothetical protein [Datura stramonium]